MGTLTTIRETADDLIAVAYNDVVNSLSLVTLNHHDDEHLARPLIARIHVAAISSAHEEKLDWTVRWFYLMHHRRAVTCLREFLYLVEADMVDGDPGPTVGDLLETFPFTDIDGCDDTECDPDCDCEDDEDNEVDFS